MMSTLAGVSCTVRPSLLALVATTFELSGVRGASFVALDGPGVAVAVAARGRPDVRAWTCVRAVSAPARLTGLRLGEVTTTGPIELGSPAAGAAVCPNPGSAVVANNTANRPSGVSEEQARANIGAKRR